MADTFYVPDFQPVELHGVTPPLGECQDCGALVQADKISTHINFHTAIRQALGG